MPMIVFNECRIDDCGLHLIIEASISNLNYYKDVYIDSIIIDTNDTFSPNGPSNNPVYTLSFEQDYVKALILEDCALVLTDEDDESKVYIPEKIGTKKVRLCLSVKDLKVSSFNDNIFFIYAIASGVPAPDTPCGMDNSLAMGIAINLRPIYNTAMKYIKEIDSSCSMPKGFIDMILRLKAFDLSLKTGNYSIAFKQWDKLFKNKRNVSPSTGCGCNGFN